MSEEEQLVEHGRLLKDHVELKLRIDALAGAAQRLGELFHALAGALLYGRALPADFDFTSCDADRAQSLLAELAEARERLQVMQARLRQFGL